MTLVAKSTYLISYCVKLSSLKRVQIWIMKDLCRVLLGVFYELFELLSEHIFSELSVSFTLFFIGCWFEASGHTVQALSSIKHALRWSRPLNELGYSRSLLEFLRKLFKSILGRSTMDEVTLYTEFTRAFLRKVSTGERRLFSFNLSLSMSVRAARALVTPTSFKVNAKLSLRLRWNVLNSR